MPLSLGYVHVSMFSDKSPSPVKLTASKPSVTERFSIVTVAV